IIAEWAKTQTDFSRSVVSPMSPNTQLKAFIRAVEPAAPRLGHVPPLRDGSASERHSRKCTQGGDHAWVHDGRLRSRRGHGCCADRGAGEATVFTPARRCHRALDDGRRARSAVVKHPTAIAR